MIVLELDPKEITRSVLMIPEGKMPDKILIPTTVLFGFKLEFADVKRVTLTYKDEPLTKGYADAGNKHK